MNTMLPKLELERAYLARGVFSDGLSRAREISGGVREGDCVFLAWLSSPLGPLVAGATDAGVCLLEFADRREMLGPWIAAMGKWFKAPVVPARNHRLDTLEAELARYFAGSLRTFSLPLVYPGTIFQRSVWEQLRTIPYGETCSYEDVAVAVGKPRAVRAVGRANGRNRIAILIPCHRVINKSGEPGGYGGGLRRKHYLLELERSRSVDPSMEPVHGVRPVTRAGLQAWQRSGEASGFWHVESVQ